MSKFSGVLQAARGQEAAIPPQEAPVLTVSRGRPKGKRSDPAFEQVTAYIRKETYLQTKMALLQEDTDRDFSQLVEELLGAYLRTQKSGLPATRTAGQ